MVRPPDRERRGAGSPRRSGRGGPAVVLTTRLFPPEPGAAAYRLGALARALTGAGAAVTVLTTRPPGAIGRETGASAGARVSRWPVLRDKGGNVRGYLQFASFDGPLLLRLLVQRTPDVVVAEPPPTTGVVVRLVSTARRIPYVYYAADLSSSAAVGIGLGWLPLTVLRRMESWVLRGAAEVLTVSDGLAREIESLTGGRANVTVVGSGVDTTVFTCEPRSPDTNTLVYAGTMSEVHGAEVFVRAFGRVHGRFPGARLIMAGQGVERATLERLAHQLAPGAVEFPGLLSSERVVPLLQSARAGLASVRPGRSYDFAYPTKMFAALACGSPVIYAGAGPGRELVRANDLGWSVDWDDEAVAAAMGDALSLSPTPDRRRELARWTHSHVSLETISRRAANVVIDAARCL